MFKGVLWYLRGVFLLKRKDKYRMKFLLGDCLERLRELESESVHSIVTDPPAGISFMGKNWDNDKGGRDNWIGWMEEIAKECLRVLKSGGHALVWAMPRTSHWTATAWEGAGFEVRDRVSHIFGSGFPKSLNISSQIDSELGFKRETVGIQKMPGYAHANVEHGQQQRSVTEFPIKSKLPITEEAKKWEGWGTALKPAMEDWWLLRKPLAEKSIGKNVLKHGVGGLNIDGCRVVASDQILLDAAVKRMTGNNNGAFQSSKNIKPNSAQGRWPSHLLHDGSDEVLAIFPHTKSGKITKEQKRELSYQAGVERGKGVNLDRGNTYGDEGSAARFFYCAKASVKEKNEGVEKNTHPTVKSIALMRYLVRLVTPTGGVVLDPFMGSGTTGVACVHEGFSFVGIEAEKEYFEIAKARVSFTQESIVSP